jgi:hypothetical protein
MAAITLTLRADQLLAAGTRALARDEVPHLLLRGPAIAQWVYTAEERRPYIDADLLVPEPLVERAGGALRAAGFEPLLEDAAPAEQAPHARTFRAPGEGGTIDLHWTLRGVGAPPDAVWEGLREGAGAIDVAGTSVAVPSEHGRALIVALHAAQHGPTGRVPLRDVELALQRVDPSVWRQAAALAERLDATAGFAAGLRLAPGGARLLEEMSIGARPTIDLALRAQGEVPLALSLAKLAETKGASTKLGMLGRELWPTPAYMRRWHPLAGKGTGGMLAARFYRPLWLAARTPAALRALRRARRTRRES